MISVQEVKKTVQIFNVLELLGILFTLVLTLGFQIFLNDLPCPLCLLQRIGFFGVALGLVMNLRLGLHPSHYSIALLSALFTSFVALRQIALHVVPGTGAYGHPFLGFHLYTWSFVIAMIILIFTSILLGVGRQYKNSLIDRMRSHWITHALLAITSLLIIVNIILLFLECGFGECPDNPIHYKYSF